MRALLPWVGALLALFLLWPTVCVSEEDGPTRCVSAMLVPLPWGEAADTWGMLVAVGAAVSVWALLRRVLRRPRVEDDASA